MLRSRVGNTLWRLDLYRGQRFRGISRELFFRCAGRFTPELVAESEGMRFRVPTYDRAVGLMSFANGPPERETMKLAVSILAKRGGWRGVEGGCFLDVGANIGTATVTALKQAGFAEAICFEPLPDNHRLLLANLAANGLSDRAQTMNLALSDHDGEADFEVSPNNSGDGRVRLDGSPGGPDAFGEDSRPVLKVKLARLDSVCDAEKGPIDLSNVSLAWIDAQGHEGQILTGAKSLLGSSIPLVTEVWPYGLKRAGGREAFVEAIRGNYERLIDLGSQTADSAPVELEASQVEAVLESYEKKSFFDPDGSKSSTDLLLL
jgi:FkbM family methyltransferase